jgi:hypothetical protein
MLVCFPLIYWLYKSQYSKIDSSDGTESLGVINQTISEKVRRVSYSEYDVDVDDVYAVVGDPGI